MLIAMIVVAVLDLLVFIYIRSGESRKIDYLKKCLRRKNGDVRDLLIANEANIKFIDFLIATLSDESINRVLKYKIFKYACALFPTNFITHTLYVRTSSFFQCTQLTFAILRFGETGVVSR